MASGVAFDRASYPEIPALVKASAAFGPIPSILVRSSEASFLVSFLGAGAAFSSFTGAASAFSSLAGVASAFLGSAFSFFGAGASAAAASLFGAVFFSSFPSFSAAFSDLRSARPAATASVTCVMMTSMDFEASSLDGITKSMGRGSELVSTMAKIGMFSFWASFTAMCSRMVSTINKAPGRRVISAIDPRFFSNLARSRSTCRRSFLESVLKVPSFFILSIDAIFFTALRMVTKFVSIPPGQRSVM